MFIFHLPRQCSEIQWSRHKTAKPRWWPCSYLCSVSPRGAARMLSSLARNWCVSVTCWQSLTHVLTILTHPEYIVFKSLSPPFSLLIWPVIAYVQVTTLLFRCSSRRWHRRSRRRGHRNRRFIRWRHRLLVWTWPRFSSCSTYSKHWLTSKVR